MKKNTKIEKMEMRIAGNIRRLRKEKGLSQAELAKKAGSHLTHINNIETGKYLPSLDSLVKISQVLEVSIDHLINDEEGVGEIKIKNQPFAERIKLLNTLNEKEQEAIMEVIDAMLTRKRILDFITNKEELVGK